MRYFWHRAIIVCVALIYVFTTIGVSVISHYCGGELQEVSVFTSPDSCCGEEEEEMPVSDDGCCKNETKHFSYRSDFFITQSSHDVKIPVNHISELFCVNTDFQLAENSISNYVHFKSFHPPNDIIQRQIVSVSSLRI